MKRTVRVALGSVVALLACDGVPVAPGNTGRLVVATVSQASVALDAGKVIVVGPSSSPTTKTVNATPGQTVTIDGLQPGSYTVALQGFVGGAVAMFGQTSGVQVVGGQDRRATVSFNSFVPAADPLPSSATGKTFTVSYAGVAGAARYQVEAATDQAFTANKVSVDVAGSQTSVNITVPNYGTFYARVRAMDAYQGTGQWATVPGSIQLKVLFEVTSVQPTDNAMNVETGAVVVAQFSDAVDPATLAVTVTSRGTTLASKVSYDMNTRTATVTAPLLPGASYQAAVTTAVRDTAGRPLAAARQWTFATRAPQSVFVAAGGRFPSLALNGGKVHVAHDNNSELDYSFCAANCTAAANWQTISVDVAGGAGSLIMDGTGRLYVMYDGDGDIDYGPCAVACTTVGNWQRVRVDQLTTTGQWPSLALDGATLHASYLKDGLRYATCRAGGAGCASTANWDTVTVDIGPQRFHTSLAVDPAGQLHVSYENGGLKYATCPSRSSSCTSATNWRTVTVDAAGSVGDKTSLAVDATGRLHVMYYDATNGDLKYATCAASCWITSNWQTVAVETTGDVGWSPWLAVDRTGRLHVTYYDLDNHRLTYATCAAGCTAADDWQMIALDQVGFGASPQLVATSMTVDGTGRVHASYSDVPNGLKYIEF